MILVDTNLLIYAVNKDAPHHQRAINWFDNLLSSDAVVGLPWIAIIGFLRITTSPKIMPNPLPDEVALKCVERWLRQPFVSAVSPGENHWPILNLLLREWGAAGNLVNDAHIAAIAVEHGYTIYSADNDFKRFGGVSHVNPLASDEVHETLAGYL